MAYTKEKGFWILLIFLLAGIVIGGLLGQLAENVSWLKWLNYGMDFGLSDPIALDLKVLKLTFGLTIHISMASIVGMAISILIYKKF